MELTPEVQEKLNSSMIDLLDTMVNAKEFAVDQMPDVIEELLVWKSMESMIAWGFCITMLTICLFVFSFIIYRMLSWNTKDRKRSSLISHDAHLCCAIASAVIFLGFLIVLADWEAASLDWLQIKVAPKAYVVDYIMGLKQ